MLLMFQVCDLFCDGDDDVDGVYDVDVDVEGVYDIDDDDGLLSDPLYQQVVFRLFHF